MILSADTAARRRACCAGRFRTRGARARASARTPGRGGKPRCVNCRWTLTATTNLPLKIFWPRTRWSRFIHDGEPFEPGARRTGTADCAAAVRLEERQMGRRRRTDLEHDRAGFWEENGYHMRGDPWTQERVQLVGSGAEATVRPRGAALHHGSARRKAAPAGAGSSCELGLNVVQHAHGMQAVGRRSRRPASAVADFVQPALVGRELDQGGGFVSSRPSA